MKKFLALLLVAVMALSFAACSNGNSSNGSGDSTYNVEEWFNKKADDIIKWESPNKKTMKVGLIVPDTTSEFYNGIAQVAKKEFEDAGYTFVFDGINNDSTRGITAIESWVASGIDAIVIMAQDKTCDLALKAAMEQGVLVVSASAEIEYYHHWLTQDNYDVGYHLLQACFTLKKHRIMKRAKNIRHYICCTE